MTCKICIITCAALHRYIFKIILKKKNKKKHFPIYQSILVKILPDNYFLNVGSALKQGILESPVLQLVQCWWTLQSLRRPVCFPVGTDLGGGYGD